TIPLQPAPESLFDLDHGYLPECRGPSSPSASEAQPNVSSAGIGGSSGWSHNWQAGWSHAGGKTSGHLVPCGWQTTMWGTLRVFVLESVQFDMIVLWVTRSWRTGSPIRSDVTRPAGCRTVGRRASFETDARRALIQFWMNPSRQNR